MRGETRALIGGRGEYSYIRVLSDEFLLKYTPPPPPKLALSCFAPVEHDIQVNIVRARNSHQKRFFQQF